MHKPFDELSEQAPIWVYQSNRKLTPAEQHTLQGLVQDFTANWTSHGRSLMAGSEIYHDYFLVLGVEKPDFDLSCCTIDGVIQFLHFVKEKLEIDFLDRKKLIIEKAGQLIVLPISEVKAKRDELGEECYIFDLTVGCKGDLKTCWRVPLKQFFT